MPFKLNKKIRDLKPYYPAVGDYRMRLDANESFLSLPENIIREITHEIRSLELNRYPDSQAKELIKAYSEFCGVDESCITAGNGSDELICVIVNAFLQKGDKVITLRPDFSMYRFYSALNEAQIIDIAKNDDLSIDIDKVIHSSNCENARLIIFSNPCNPTSLGVDREDMRKLLNSVNALVVLDEAYMEFWDQSLLGEFKDYDNLIILKTTSKAFSAAAIRLGFAVCNEHLTNALKSVKSPYNVNALTQVAGRCIYSHKQELEDAQRTIKSSLTMLYNRVKAIQESYPCFELMESRTNFVLLRFKDWELAERIFKYLQSNGIIVRKFDNCLRITCSREEDNEETLKLILEVIKNEESSNNKKDARN